MQRYKKVHVTLGIVFLLMFCSGCNFEMPFSAGNGNDYRVLTSAEVQEFIAENNIQALDVKNINRSTVIVYQTVVETGYYGLSIGKDGMLVKDQNYIESDQSSPLSVGARLTAPPFIMIVFNDVNIERQAETIEVTFRNSMQSVQVPTNGKRGIIVSEGIPNAEWRTITVYDANGNEIYRTEW